MRIAIDPKGGTPIYRQIMDQVGYLVASGRLKAGDEMPPIRMLAQELLINPNTVARAYRELEAQGVLRSRQGSGTVVSENGSPLAAGQKRRILTERVDRLLAEAAQLGFGRDALWALLEERGACIAWPAELEGQDNA